LVPAIILVLATLLYYERIAVREEAFLADRFGGEFEAWSSRVRACRPSFAAYTRSAIPYSWRKVLRHEFHGLLVIGPPVPSCSTPSRSAGARARGARTTRGLVLRGERGTLRDLRGAEARHAAVRGVMHGVALRDDIDAALRGLPGWRREGNALVKDFTFAGFPRRRRS